MSKVKNVLEKEFISMITPFHWISGIFFLRKFHINGTEISAKTKRDVFYLGMGMFIVYYFLISTLTSLVDVYDDISIFYVYIIAYSQYAVNYTILCFFNYVHSKFNVELLLKLQTIDRYLYDAADTKKIRCIVWTSCTSLVVAYVMFVTLKLTYDPTWSWSRGAFIVTSLIFDVELAYCTFIAYYLARKMARWAEIIQFDDKNPHVLLDDIGIMLVEMLFKVYDELLAALVLVRKAAQFAILLHFVIMFIQSLTYIQILLLMIQNQKLLPVSVSSHAYGVTLWISKAVVMESTFCIICEILYRRIISAEIVVVFYVNHYTCRRSRRLFKNIERLNLIKFKKLSICGIFVVDAGLPLRLAALMTNYTVILLQFAFLRN